MKQCVIEAIQYISDAVLRKDTSLEVIGKLTKLIKLKVKFPRFACVVIVKLRSICQQRFLLTTGEFSLIKKFSCLSEICFHNPNSFNCFFYTFLIIYIEEKRIIHVFYQ